MRTTIIYWVYLLGDILASLAIPFMSAVDDSPAESTFEKIVAVIDLTKTLREINLSDLSPDSKKALLDRAIKYDCVQSVIFLEPVERLFILTRAHFYDSPKVYLHALTLYTRPIISTDLVTITITARRPKIFRELLENRAFDFSRAVEKLIGNTRSLDCGHELIEKTTSLLSEILHERPEIVEVLQRQENTVKSNLLYRDSMLERFLANFTSKAFPLDLLKTEASLIYKTVFPCYQRGDFNSEGFFVDVQGNLTEAYLDAAIYNPDPLLFPLLYDFVISAIINIAPVHPGKPLVSQSEITSTIGRMFENRITIDEDLVELIHDRRIPFSVKSRAFQANNYKRALSCLYRPIAEKVLIELTSKDRFVSGHLWIPEEIAEGILSSHFLY